MDLLVESGIHNISLNYNTYGASPANSRYFFFCAQPIRTRKTYQ